MIERTSDIRPEISRVFSRHACADCIAFNRQERRKTMREMTFDKTRTVSWVLWVAVGVWLLSTVQAAEAQTTEPQTTVGGHVGFVLPLVTHAGGETTNLVDNFSIGFPLGVTFKRAGRMAYDLELVPAVQGTPRLTT